MRTFRTLVFAALATALPAWAAPNGTLAALAERYYEAQVRFDPVATGTLQGDNRFDDRLPLTIAPAERQKRFAMYRRVQHELAAIPRAALDEHDALTYDLLKRELETRLGFERFPDHLLPLEQMGSIPLLLANFGSGQAEQPLQTVAQYDTYLKRIGALPAWSAQAIANMREGIRRGVVRPRAVVVATLKQLKALGSAQLEDSPFLAPVRNLPSSFPAADRQRLAASYRRSVEQRIAPAMRELAAFVEREYLPSAPEAAGWSALPDGAAWYRQWVREQTTTDLTPEAIHALGLKEVARIQGELARIAPELGYEGDPKHLLSWVRSQPRFLPYRSEAQILDAYRGINEKVKAKLPQLFGRWPKAPLDIRPEPELTKATASDHYALPAEDGSRPGIFWAVINDPKEQDATVMTALFLHEGQPGHHFQMALQQEMKALPQFRQRAWINAFGEGWALYAETLGRELGLYDDPAAYVGELRLEIFRASRLVVDTGLHAFGWSRDKAIAYFAETTGFTETQARNQIDRYMAWPGQALGYKIGSLKIQELRERAQAALGPRFSIAEFHDTVLGEGGLPLALLEARIDRWIATRRPS